MSASGLRSARSGDRMRSLIPRSAAACSRAADHRFHCAPHIPSTTTRRASPEPAAATIYCAKLPYPSFIRASAGRSIRDQLIGCVRIVVCSFP